MTASNQVVKDVAAQEYKYGFVTDVESDFAPPGLSEETVRFISAKKNEPEWMLEGRLKAYKYFTTLVDKEQVPQWAHLRYNPINFQDIIYYSAPKQKVSLWLFSLWFLSYKVIKDNPVCDNMSKPIFVFPVMLPLASC